jgi:acyl carrier protein
MSDTILDEVRRIAGDVLGVPFDQVTAASSRDTLPSWDSLAHVNLVLALEQRFGVQFLPEEMMEMLNIDLVAMILSEKVAQKAAGG